MAQQAVVSNLPAELNSFVGRERELAEVADLLDRVRLITLSGAPGTGKTRLATRVAANARKRFPDGTWFVDLSSALDDSTVAPRIAAALGIADSAGTTIEDAIASSLRTKKMLLVIDNFEHVLGAAPLVARLLSATSQLHVLVTSRATLRLTGEHDFVVPPLSLERSDDDLSPCGRLFTIRAIAAKPGFAATPPELEAVERICRAVDGLPLAIELAAARIRFLGPAAIAERLEHRLALLSSGPSDAPARHQSIRAAIAWSHELLPDPERALFRRLGVLAGTFDLEAVEAIVPSDTAAEVLDLLGALVDKSLVMALDGPDGTVRFRLLETLREYASEQLDLAGGRGEAERALIAHFLARAQAIVPHLTRAGNKAWLDRLELDIDNYRWVQELAILRGDGETAVRLSGALWRWWQIRGHLREGQDLTRRSLMIPGIPEALQADGESAAGSIAYWLGDPVGAQDHYRRALHIHRRSGAPSQVGNALYDLSLALTVDPEHSKRLRATKLLQEALSLFESAGDREGRAKAIWGLGSAILYSQGDPTEAHSLLDESVGAFREVGDEMMLGWALYMVGGADLKLGDYAGAEAAYREALALFAAADDLAGMQFLLDSFSKLALSQGDTLRGLRLAGAAAGTRRTTGEELGLAADLLRVNPEGRLIDEAARRQAFDEGAAMDAQTAVNMALGRSEEPRASGVNVAALGPLRVGVGSVDVQGWGGGKAGGRQAKALFAFLFDRGAEGVSKDEVVELIWPDADLDAGDLAFHRTMLGLRRTLTDALGEPVPTVELRHGRYRLVDDLIGWSDVNEFEDLLATAESATDDSAAIRQLEQARRLYRGDYLDDCPIYGDAAFVETTRQRLRARYVELLLNLGERYEARGDRSAAAALFQAGLDAASDDSPRAEAALVRLGLTVRLKAPDGAQSSK